MPGASHGFGHLPKAELHCHFIGTIHPTTLEALQVAGQPTLISADKVRAAYPAQGLEGFARWLAATLPYQTARLEHILPIFWNHIRALIAQRVVYAEIMISPTNFAPDIEGCVREMQALRQWLCLQEAGQIQVELLMVMPRTLTDGVIQRDVEKFVALAQAQLICGVAVVGWEDELSLQHFARGFATLKQAGLGLEIHAGEHDGPDAVHEAIDLGADRIGHGISLFRDAALVQLVQTRNIHIEFCPSSNLATGSVLSLRQHPIQKARALGLSYSVNTDDPGTFECSMESEYALLADQLGFTEADFQTIARNTLEARFAKQLRYQNTLNLA